MALDWAALRSQRVVLQVADQLGAQVARLRPQVAGALAAAGELVGEAVGLEEDHRLRRHGAVLGGAQRKHVHAGPPGDGGGAAAQRGQRVGEAGAVHVHGEAEVAGGGADRAHLLQAVDRAPFGGLGEADRGRLALVHADGAAGLQVGGQGGGRQPAVAAGQGQQLGAAGEELGRAALVVLDVRGRVAIDAAEGRHQRGEGQRVGRRAGGDGEHLGVRRLEGLAHQLLQARGPGVGAIGGSGAVVGAGHGLQDGGADRADVVAAEVLAYGSHAPILPATRRCCQPGAPGR